VGIHEKNVGPSIINTSWPMITIYWLKSAQFVPRGGQPLHIAEISRFVPPNLSPFPGPAPPRPPPPTATHAAHGLLLREHGRADGGAPGPPAAGVEPQRGGGGAPNPRPRAGALRPGVQGHRGRRLRRGRRLPQPRARDQVRLRAPSLLSRAGLGGYEFRFGRAVLRSALWICWKLDGGALSCFN
jgi:hypothetical protein